jgi:hypothetical protein
MNLLSYFLCLSFGSVDGDVCLGNQPLIVIAAYTHAEIAFIAWLIFEATGNPDSVANWYAAESNLRSIAADQGFTIVVFDN